MRKCGICFKEIPEGFDFECHACNLPLCDECSESHECEPIGCDEDPLDDDRDDGPMEFGPERYRNGKYNMRRARALDRIARMTYEFDRDF